MRKSKQSIRKSISKRSFNNKRELTVFERTKYSRQEKLLTKYSKHQQKTHSNNSSENCLDRNSLNEFADDSARDPKKENGSDL